MTIWKRSSFCGESACIEVSRGCDLGHCLEAGRNGHDEVLVRNTRTPDLDPVRFTPAQWKLFLDAVRGDGPRWSWFRDQDDITYDAEEAEAFRSGVLAGEFDYENLPRIDEG